MKEKQGFLSKPGVNAFLASLVCIVIGLVVGYISLVVLSWTSAASAAAEAGTAVDFGQVLSDAWTSGFKQILMGGFFMNHIGVGREIASAAPLIMTGLSVGFAFKTGLFNIGAAGQYTVGAFGGLLCAIVFEWPWWACLIGATVFGALWGAIPGIFKAYLNINEVITAIMFNWIGLYAVNTIMYGGGTGVMYDATRTKTWALRSAYPDSVIPDFGLGTYFQNRSTTIAIFLAIIVAVIIYVVLNKTTFGYELKACGLNKDAARYAGISEKRNIVLSMVISGGLAGFGAGLYYLSGVAEWSPMNSTALPGIGFDGISVALLASSNPIGTIFSAIFISHITTGGGFMNASIFPPEVADVISGIIIYLCAFALLFRGALSHRRKKKGEAAALPASAPEDDAPDAPMGGKEEEA